MSQILILTPQYPYPPQALTGRSQGTTLRNFNLIAGLSRRHAVDLLTFVGEDDDEEDLARGAKMLAAFCRKIVTVTAPARTTRQRALDTAVPPETAASEPYLRPAISNLLERDGHYRVLAHAHWIQTLDPTGKAAVKPVRIASARPDELEGTVQFNMSRYLHLDVNLLYRDEEAMKGGVVYRIGEQRRVKSLETQYFDHPKFGVLVRVMPVEKDKKP